MKFMKRVRVDNTNTDYGYMVYGGGTVVYCDDLDDLNRELYTPVQNVSSYDGNVPLVTDLQKFANLNDLEVVPDCDPHMDTYELHDRNRNIKFVLTDYDDEKMFMHLMLTGNPSVKLEMPEEVD